MTLSLDLIQKQDHSSPKPVAFFSDILVTISLLVSVYCFNFAAIKHNKVLT